MDEKARRKEQMRAEMYALHSENFRLIGIDLELKSERGTRVVSLHAGVWRCTCDLFQEQEPCGHIMAARLILDGAFSQSSEYHEHEQLL